MDVFEKSKRKFRIYSALVIILAVALVGWGGYTVWMGRTWQVDPLVLAGALMCLWIYTLLDAARTIDVLTKENYLLRRQNIDRERRFVQAQDARVERLMR